LQNYGEHAQLRRRATHDAMERQIWCRGIDRETKFLLSKRFFGEFGCVIEMRKLEVKFNKPIYVGMCIFNISKMFV